MANPDAFKISAPGKMSLFGEYAVSYGRSVLSCGIDLRTNLYFEKSKTDNFKLNLCNYNSTVIFSYENFCYLMLFEKPSLRNGVDIDRYNWRTPELLNVEEFVSKMHEFVHKVVKTKIRNSEHELMLIVLFLLMKGILCSVDIEVQPFTITVDSTIPSGSGTGNLTAFVVCVTAALIHYLHIRVSEEGRQNEFVSKLQYLPFKLNFSKVTGNMIGAEEKDLISHWSRVCEVIQDNYPIGVESAVATYGKMIQFSSSPNAIAPSVKVYTHVTMLEFLLVNTGIHTNKTNVAHKLLQFSKRHPGIIEGLCMLGQILTDAATEMIANANLSTDAFEQEQPGQFSFGELLDVHYFSYFGVGIINETQHEVHEIIRSSGFHSTQLVSDQGGHAAVFIPPNTPKSELQTLRDSLSHRGYSSTLTHLGAPGLTITDVL
ncbi:uncharacterized protein Mvk isoform X2 [Periplaneta americana]|uniref:uncharacterized protein Mvk isoform X2 n=1 Tax=Periplaneta americana TaxID=6978 RepID=UPI0037E7D51D